MIDLGELERVEPDEEAARAALDEARRHAASAVRIAESDPHGALQLAYDGARKAIVGHLRSKGLRVRAREGAHVITGRYAGAAIDDGLGKRFERMRQKRNRSEYGVAHVAADEVDIAVETATALAEAVSKSLG